MTKRKPPRSDYVGCSLTSHHGGLRLEWRVRDDEGSRRVTWSTGAPDTPEHRERWEPVRHLVATLRARGQDPLQHLRQHHAPTAPDVPTVRSFYQEWIASKVGDVRPALLRDYRRHFTGYILSDAVFADLALAELRPLDIQLLRARLRTRPSRRTGTPISEKTVHGIVNASLRAMLRDARVQDLLVRDVHVGLTWKRMDPPPADPLTAAEWDRIAAWFAGREFPRKLVWRQHPAFHAFVFFLRWHGARPSEAAALTWDNVDLPAGIAYIRASFHCGVVGEPKTTAAHRSIELHPEMLSILRALRPLRPAPGQPVFPNLDAQRITPKTFWQTWTRCLQDLRIRHRGLYSLKDTFVTHTLAMAEESGDVERLTAWLQRQTGVRLDTLKRHYERWWPRDRAAIRATYALLDPSLGTNCHPIATRATRNPAGTATGTGMVTP
jgi:integrase